MDFTTAKLRLTVGKGQVEIDKVTQVLLSSGKRMRTKDDMLPLYQGAMFQEARWEEVDVPIFPASYGVLDVVKMRERLDRVLAKTLAAEEKSRAIGSKGIEYECVIYLE